MRVWPGGRSTAGVALVIGLAVLGCAPLQRVPVLVEPGNSTLFVDGEALGVTPAELELRSDRDHVLFFKSEGFRPERVILRSSTLGDEPRLEPAEVIVSLTPLSAKGRALRIEEVAPASE